MLKANRKMWKSLNVVQPMRTDTQPQTAKLIVNITAIIIAYHSFVAVRTGQDQLSWKVGVSSGEGR